MIPADRITINGYTALWVVDDHTFHHGIKQLSDRPCDTCGGSGREDCECCGNVSCDDCDGTGQHTFKITAYDTLCMSDSGHEPTGNGCHFCGQDPETLTVHVIDVVPIYEYGNWQMLRGECVMMEDGAQSVVLSDGMVKHSINLPSAAEPGMYLVRMKIHE